MANYRISGVWKDTNEVITHYAFHKVGKTTMTNASKTPKTEAIKLVETNGNKVKTMTWNYSRANWDIGEEVHVVNGKKGKHLRSNPDDELTDNLGHLIDFDWITK